MKKQRLLFVIEGNSSCGAVVAMRWLLNALSSTQRYDITLFHTCFGGRVERISDSVSQIGYPKWVTRERVGCKTVWRAVLHPILALQQIGFRLIERHPEWTGKKMSLFCAHKKKYDVAIGFTDDFANRIVGGFNAKRHFAWCHEDYSRELCSTGKRNATRQYLQQLNGVFCVSEVSRRSMIELLGEAYANRVHVCHNLLPVERVTSCGLPASGRLEVVSVGRLVEAKRFNWCIEAATILKGRGADFHWTIYGEGELRNQLSEMIGKLGVGDCVSLPGSFSNWWERVPKNAIYVQPSQREGWGLAIEEAALAGFRVVCSDLPVFHELQTFLGTTFSFVGSSEELARTIADVSNLYPAHINQSILERAYETDISKLNSVIA